MFIENIRIKSFGRLSDFSVDLARGMNVFEGDNESGKSTLAEFIKFMLYGMQSKAVGDRELSERKKYISWDTSMAAGSMTVDCDGKKILIERSIIAATDGAGVVSYKESLRMTDAETGAQLHRGKNPGEVLLGVPEDIFSGTAFIRQFSGARVDGGKLSSSAENLLFSADEAINTEKSIERIDSVRRQLLYKNGRGGSLYEKERKRDELTGKLEAAKRVAGELIAVENSISELTANRDNAEEKRDASRKKNENYEAVKKLHLFDDIHALENELSTLYTDREELLAKGLVGEHFPDPEYVAELKQTSDSIAVLSALIASLSRRIDEVKRERGSEEEIGKKRDLLESEDAVDNIADSARALQRKRSAFIKTFAFLMTFTVAFAVIALIAMFSGVSLTFANLINVTPEKGRFMLLAIGAVGALACAVPAIVLFLVSISIRGRLTKLAAYYGAESAEELPIVLDDLYVDAIRDVELEEELASLEGELHDKYVAYDEEIMRGRDLILRRGVEGADENVPELLRTVLTESEEICACERAISEKTEDRRQRKDALTAQLDGADEKEVRLITEALNIPEYDAMSQATIRLERDFHENAVIRLTETIHELEVKRVQLMSSREDPAELAVKLASLTEEMQNERRRYDACVLAMETLAVAGESVRASVIPRIREYAKGYLSGITKGKYDGIGVDGEFSLTVDADGAFRELEYMSEGTADAAYLSLRLALCRLLYRKTMPPIIFDEAFARLDDERAAAAMSILMGRNGAAVPQSILFTCQKREGRLLTELYPDDANLIRL